EVDVRIDARDSRTPTPAVSHAILSHHRATTSDGVRTTGPGLADGIVVTPSHNPPRDGGFKYNPPHGGPADSDATSWIAGRANELLADMAAVQRVPFERACGDVTRFDYLGAYCEDLVNALNLHAIRDAGVHIGADPLGAASVQYWAYIAEHLGIDPTA